MKKVIIGLLALGSLSAFPGEICSQFSEIKLAHGNISVIGSNYQHNFTLDSKTGRQIVKAMNDHGYEKSICFTGPCLTDSCNALDIKKVHLKL